MNTLLLDLRVFVSFEEPIVVVEVMIVNVAESQYGFVPHWVRDSGPGRGNPIAGKDDSKHLKYSSFRGPQNCGSAPFTILWTHKEQFITSGTPSFLHHFCFGSAEWCGDDPAQKSVPLSSFKFNCCTWNRFTCRSHQIGWTFDGTINRMSVIRHTSDPHICHW